MLDYSQYQTTPAIPEASSMIETFRAIGYNIGTAVADIIDISVRFAEITCGSIKIKINDGIPS